MTPHDATPALDTAIQAEPGDLAAWDETSGHVDYAAETYTTDPGRTAYFDGDTGQLPMPARRALILLLKQTHVTALTNPREWQAILDHRDPITSRLNDMFLELHVDPAREVAYKRQAGQEQGQRFPTLLATRTYSRDEVALLLHVRGAYERAVQAAEDAAFVEREELLEAIRLIRPRREDGVRADEKAARAIDQLGDDRILLPTGDSDRFKVSPVVRTVITSERLPLFHDALSDAVPATEPADDSETAEATSGDSRDLYLDESLSLEDDDA